MDFMSFLHDRLDKCSTQDELAEMAERITTWYKTKGAISVEDYGNLCVDISKRSDAMNTSV